MDYMQQIKHIAVNFHYNQRITWSRTSYLHTRLGKVLRSAWRRRRGQRGWRGHGRQGEHHGRRERHGRLGHGRLGYGQLGQLEQRGRQIHPGSDPQRILPSWWEQDRGELRPSCQKLGWLGRTPGGQPWQLRRGKQWRPEILRYQRLIYWVTDMALNLREDVV